MEQAIQSATQVVQLAAWWALAALLILATFLVLSTVAELLSRGFGRALMRWARVSAARFRSLWERASGVGDKISARLAEISDPKFRLIFHESEKRLIARLESIESAIKIDQSKVEELNRKLSADVDRNSGHLESYVEKSGKKINWPEFRSNLEVLKSYGLKDRALFWFLFVVAAFAVGGNTLLINEFISSLDYTRIEILGLEIRISLLISLIISSIEVGIGVAISALSVKSDTEKPLLWLWIAFFYTVVFSFVVLELWLYTMLASSFNSADIARVSDALPIAQYGFAVVGIIFGLGIPALGYACHAQYEKNKRRASLSALHKFVTSAAEYSDKLPELNREVAKTASDANASLAEFRKALVDGDAPEISAHLSGVLNEFRDEVVQAKNDRREIYADLSDEDAKLRLNSPLGIAAIFVGVLAGLYVLLFGSLMESFGGGPAMVFSATWAGAALMAGRFAFGRVTLVQEAGQNSARIVAADMNGVLRWISISAIVGLVVLGIITAIDFSTGQVDWQTLVFLLVLNLVIPLLGHMLDTVVDGFRALLGILVVVAIAILGWVTACCFFLTRAFFIAIANMLSALGYPARALYQRIERIGSKSVEVADDV